ncbi:MAG: phosphoenolpyruvate--protein phosphotransferase [Elusimicrobiota bacterium]
MTPIEEVKEKKMQELRGISVSPGIAIGNVCLYSREAYETVPHYNISGNRIAREIKRLNEAFKTAEESLNEMKKVSRKMFGKQGEEIIAAHLAILNDANLKKRITQEIKKNKINAEHAAFDVFEEYVERFSEKTFHFEELSHDVKDVRDRLIESFGLTGGEFACPLGEKEPVIVASERLSTSMILNLSRENVLSFVAKEGGYTSHATILARTLNVPVLFGIDVKKDLRCKDKAVVDGNLGRMMVYPDAKTLDRYRKKIKLMSERAKVCGKDFEKPPKTGEGKRIKLKVNISTVQEMDIFNEILLDKGDSQSVNYDGIGLLRTEFLFGMHKDSIPDEEEQFRIYNSIIKTNKNKPTVIRVLDISRDKSPPYIKVPPGVDPDLNIRGARAVMLYKDMYLTQMRAILRSAVNGEINLLFPMVSDKDDILTFKNLVKQAEESLKEDGLKYDIPSMGIMFETPSSVVLAKELLREIDFANIGTNDLMQYSLASSRESFISQNRYFIMHPSIIKMLEIIADASKETGKETCLCGEIASFEEYFPIFLDLGLKSFSVPVSKYNDIKCHLNYIYEKDYKNKTRDYLKNLTSESQRKFFEH